MAGVAVVAAVVGIAGPGARGDLLASLGVRRQLALRGRPRATTPTCSATRRRCAHLWSLAIEEQFYLLFPLVFVAVMRGRGSGWPGLRPCGLGARRGVSFALAAGAAAGGNTGLAYYATFTRAGEVLVGVVAAYLVVSGPGRQAAGRASGAGRPRRSPPPWRWAASALLWHATTLGSPGLFRGRDRPQRPVHGRGRGRP